MLFIIASLLLAYQNDLIIPPIDNAIELSKEQVIFSQLTKSVWEIGAGLDSFFALIQNEQMICAFDTNGHINNTWKVKLPDSEHPLPLQGMMVSNNGKNVSVFSPQNEEQYFFNKDGVLASSRKIYRFHMPGNDFGDYHVRSIVRSDPAVPFAVIISPSGEVIKELRTPDRLSEAAKMSIYYPPVKNGDFLYFVSKKFSIMLKYDQKHESIVELPIEYKHADIIKDFNIMKAEIAGNIIVLHDVFGTPAQFEEGLLIPVWNNGQCLEMIHVNFDGSFIKAFQFYGLDKVPLVSLYHLASIKEDSRTIVAAGCLLPGKPSLIISFPEE